MTFARTLIPLLERLDDYDGAMDELQASVKEEYATFSTEARQEMTRRKLGFAEFTAGDAEGIVKQLSELMLKSSVDHTMLWRQFSCVTDADAAAVVDAKRAAETAETAETSEAAAEEAAAASEALFSHLSSAFYEDPSGGLREEWFEFARAYGLRLHADGRDEGERRAEQRATSPKFIPREWMLANAYTAAEEGDLSIVQELFGLFSSPFDEHPELARKYYRLTPENVRGKAGISYFS